MARLLDALAETVLLCDGGVGSAVQQMALDVAADFWGAENCTEVLNLSRADIVRDIHGRFLSAGADVIQTNSFGGSPITLGEFDGLAERAEEINLRAAQLACEAAEPVRRERECFVLGAIGPGTKLPSLGHIDYDTLEAGLIVQARGLLRGGVDGILVETCQDPLQIKAAVNAAKAARAAAGVEAPILVQMTVETTGTLLVGPDVAAATTLIEALDVPLIGLNCATGPQEMAEHLRWLSQNWPGLLSVQPNAGLPELCDGHVHYPLSARELATWMARFVDELGVNLIGGCCGTTPEHIAALHAMLLERGEGRRRPRPAARSATWQPAVASLFAQTPLRQENAYFSIGERCNANGSRQWRQLQEAGDWDGCVAMAVEQVKEGSNALDLCTAFVGRDEHGDMIEAVRHVTGAATAPLVIDSTETSVIEAALKRYGGKPIINSINFEDGEGHAHDRLRLAKRFGCAVIALTIDESGMAKTAEHKLAIARRLVAFACERHGLAQSDLLIDPLTFTIATGNEDDRRLGLETLEGIRLIRAEFPQVQILLGLSNISFGLKPAARQVVNSVYLDHAIRAGMTAAIANVSKIVPYHQIPADRVGVVEDLIFDRRREQYDPLQELLALFADGDVAPVAVARADEPVEERLKRRIVEGQRKGLDDDLAAAMRQHAPLDIVNTILLDGMKVVGELFGAGKMQLPFVLKSAETMKAAVAYLEPHMERVEGQEKGTVVLATVRGDVHDIGKNLVDIILTNNGYRVVNLGIKQPIANILGAAREHRADAIGMSGLLVKSTVVMRENLQELTREGVTVPVMLGGAALTREYVESDCVAAYGCGRVAYARDAFDGLAMMQRIKQGEFDTYVAALARQRAQRAQRRRRRADGPELGAPAVDRGKFRARRLRLAADCAVPTPPFWGARVVDFVNPRALVPYINERSLFQLQWGFRKSGRTLEQFMDWARQELRPVLKRILEVCEQQNVLRAQAVYGYWKAAGEGNDLVVFAEDGERELTRFTLPRQAREDGDCIADFVRDIDSGERDVIAMQVVTMGAQVSELARQWFEENRYQDYLYLHGLGVEMAEALAEYIHKRIRAELGFAGEDASSITALLSQGYHGSRFSFGYPACPRVEDQTQLFNLLDCERIGVSLSEEFQIHPEQSTSALVIHHPRARYFTI
ncbi:MAG: methionine synthase [Proteobacteria bacterium]|nr:methionine synthase [Pseudomonadota bacterium]